MKKIWLSLIFLISGLSISVSATVGWEVKPGAAKDIGVGADGSVWIVGTNERGVGYGIYSWDGNKWIESDGAGVRVDVDPFGVPWVVNSRGNIFRKNKGENWRKMPGSAKDIGIGADGSVWIIEMTKTNGGYTIAYWDGDRWVRTDGGAVRIDVDPEGNAWIVNSYGEIFRRVDTTWKKMPGFATDIGIGADGSVWITGTNKLGEGYGIYSWNGNTWDSVDGSATAISVGRRKPWVVNSKGYIFQRQ